MQRFRRAECGVAPILFLVIALLTPLAYASPPDPSWIKGVYDGADFDDVVVLVTSGAGVVDLTWFADLSPVPPPATPLVLETASSPLTPSSTALHSRAPPAR